MSTSVTFNSAHRISLTSEFFLARRLILDRLQSPAAYELRFCGFDDRGEEGAEGGEQPETTSPSVISDVAAHGLLRIIGDLPAYLHVDEQALLSDMFRLLPAQRIVLELMEATPASQAVLAKVALLEHGGFTFALDLDDRRCAAVMPEGDDDPLLALARTVKIDIAGREQRELAGLCAALRGRRKLLLADNVETADDFARCLELGFDYFRGYYFTRPAIVPGKRLSPSQLAITELMALIASDADSAEIELRVKRDVALGLNLLRLVNTPAVSAHPIDSLRQALMVLGRNQLQRWLQVMLYAEGGSGISGVLPLLIIATARGRLLELATQKLRPGNRGLADTGFTVGIMSLMDTLFSMPMEEILQQIAVAGEVRDALLHRQGYFGDLLKLSEYAEWGGNSGASLRELLRQLRLSYSDLYALQLAAFEWSDQVVHSVR